MSRDPARLRGEKTVLAIVSIALVATIAVPTNARLPWLIHNASKIALRPAATWWSSGHPQRPKIFSRTMVSCPAPCLCSSA
jgi:hypothetical protein